jgi:hypothetical protein
LAVTVARPKGRNLSEAERIVYGDRALALKLAGKTYDEITDEVPVHKNTVGSLIREAARRRVQDRDLTEEINRGIAIQRQLIEDMMRDFRSIGSGTSQRANARANLASQIIKAQMNLLFLSGVEIPDPEQIVMDALESMNVPIPELSDLLSQPTGFPSVRELPDPSPEPPEEYVIPPHKPTRDRTSVPPDARADADDGGDFRYSDPPISY